MASLSAIRTGLKTRLATITGLKAHDVWPDTVNCPAALVRPTSWDYRQSIGDNNRITFEVVVLAASLQNGLARAQEQLDPFLDDVGKSSIKAALEGDKTLSSSATTLNVVRATDYGSLVVGDIEYMGARFEVEVWA